MSGKNGRNHDVRRHAPEAERVVQFAAARAHDVLDDLHAKAKHRIDGAQAVLDELRVEDLWARARPLLLGGLRFTREYPWRTATIVALLAGALLLTRTPTATVPARSP